MLKGFTKIIAIFCTLSVTMLQTPCTYAEGEESLVEIVRYIEKLPEEMQLAVLLKLMKHLSNPMLKQPKKRTFKEFSVDDQAAWAASFSVDGSKLALGSSDRVIRIWDVETEKEIKALVGHGGVVNTVCYSPDGLGLASGSVDRTIRIWDTETGKQRHKLIGHTGQVNTVCYSPDGLTLASGSDDNTVKTWAIQTGKLSQTLMGHEYVVTTVCYSPDGVTLASGSNDETIRIWDTRTGEEIRTWSSPHKFLTSVCYSPDGLTLATGSDDGTIQLWDTQTGKELHKFTGCLDCVRKVCFSPDGTKLAAAFYDPYEASDIGIVKIWDAGTGKEIKTLGRHRNLVNTVSFSPDGLKLASVSHYADALAPQNGIVKVWNLYDKEDLELLKEIDRLGPRQVFLLYVLYRNGEDLRPGEKIQLTKTENALKQEYSQKGQETPELLNLRASYHTLSPELKELLRQVFRVVD